MTQAIELLKKIKEAWDKTPNERLFSIEMSKLMPELIRLIKEPEQPGFKPRKFKWLNDSITFNSPQEIAKDTQGNEWTLLEVLMPRYKDRWIEVPYKPENKS